MKPPILSSVLKAIAVIAHLRGRGDMDKDAARAFAEDLAPFPERTVIEALDRCRKELRTFPTYQDVMDRMNDGRPNAEEAWGLIPKSENDTVVWTPEMQEAHARVRVQIDSGDLIPARKAFTEVYQPLLARARSSGQPVTWTISLGLDKELAARPLRDAVERRRIAPGEALALLPDFETTRAEQKLLPGSEQKQLPGSTAPAQLGSIKDVVRSIKAQVLEDAPAALRARVRIQENPELAEDGDPAESARKRAAYREQLKRMESSE